MLKKIILIIILLIVILGVDFLLKKEDNKEYYIKEVLLNNKLNQDNVFYLNKYFNSIHDSPLLKIYTDKYSILISDQIKYEKDYFNNIENFLKNFQKDQYINYISYTEDNISLYESILSANKKDILQNKISNINNFEIKKKSNSITISLNDKEKNFGKEELIVGDYYISKTGFLLGKNNFLGVSISDRSPFLGKLTIIKNTDILKRNKNTYPVIKIIKQKQLGEGEGSFIINKNNKTLMLSLFYNYKNEIFGEVNDEKELFQKTLNVYGFYNNLNDLLFKYKDIKILKKEENKILIETKNEYIYFFIDKKEEVNIDYKKISEGEKKYIFTDIYMIFNKDKFKKTFNINKIKILGNNIF